MTNKEKLLQLRHDFYNNVIDYDSKAYFISIEKDLEELEEIKKIMGTPIQDIMKRLKVLEILKKCENESGTKDYHFDYYTFFVERESEDYKLIEDWWWLENGKD